ncbi:hypothetical protein [Acidocella facilis]|nr:hypothetical protein [Acidocella facilis]
MIKSRLPRGAARGFLAYAAAAQSARHSTSIEAISKSAAAG